MKAARRKAWELGTIASFYLRDDQLPVYYSLHLLRSPFFEASRRFGKTTTILIYVLELLRANPGWICRWVLPEKGQARRIVVEEMDKLQQDCPEHLKFKYHTTDSVYKGPGNSRLYLYGVDKDKGRNLRGETSNIVVCDEFGFWSDPKILNSVLRPTLLTTRGQLIIASTPAEDTAHPYYSEYEKAVRLNRFFQRTIYDNGSLTPEQIAEAMEEAGGPLSVTWRREYLCEHIGNPDLLVVPEWNNENIVPDDYPRPEYFTPYVGGDSGADDNTAVLFGYYDFLSNEVVIEDEYVTNGKTTEEIIANAKVKEAELWKSLKPFRRVYDADKQLVFDICSTYSYPMEMPEKADKITAIHNFRKRVGARKFKVKARCTHTIRTIQHGQWKDRRHLDFQRSDELGHLDPLAAALYLNRSVITTINPWPHNPGKSVYTHYMPAPSSQVSEDEQLLAALSPISRG